MKKIQLTQNQIALVDDEDFERINQYKWYAVKCKQTYYAQRQVRIPLTNKRKTYHLHKVILNTDQQVDHIDSNGLNNQKYNLRLCNNKQNSYNKRSTKGSSKYKGVHKTKSNTFETQIKINYKSYNIGRNNDEIICAKYYDCVARFYHGEFAKCNFIEIHIKPMSKEDAKKEMKELNINLKKHL